MYDLAWNRIKYDQNLFFPSSRFEPPLAPDVQIFQETAVDAFPICIVGFAVAFAVAKVYAVKHDYVIDGNQVSATVMYESGKIVQQIMLQKS